LVTLLLLDFKLLKMQIHVLSAGQLLKGAEISLKILIAAVQHLMARARGASKTVKARSFLSR
jgi:hypothetical protein